MPETEIASLVRQYISEELNGVYTVSVVIVESVDYENMRCSVSLKRDKEAIPGEIPIASSFANGEGYGIVTPIKKEDEGLLFHTKTPIDKLKKEKGHIKPEQFTQQRNFDIDDAVFFPLFWNDNDKTPKQKLSSFKSGDYVISHETGTVFQIKGSEHSDAGSVVVQTDSGAAMKLDESVGTFMLREKSGYGIEGDGSGNFTWHAKDVNFEDSTFTL